MDAAECDDWLQEAVLEYLQVHEEFKTLVDELLTTFLLELGVPLEVFCDVLSSANTEKLNSVVINTILTVDDFVHFKATMLKRNLELTTQVLDNLELPSRGSTGIEAPFASCTLTGNSDSTGEKGTSSKDATSKATTDEDTFETSGIDDDDPELAWAIAESLRQSCANRLEIAELEQAIALSLAVGDDHVRTGDTKADQNLPKESTNTGGDPCEAGPSSPFPSCETQDIAPASSRAPTSTIGDLPGTSAGHQQANNHENNFPSDHRCKEQARRDGKEPASAATAPTCDEDDARGTSECEAGKGNRASRWDGYSRRTPAKGSKAVRAAAVEAAAAQKSVLAAQKELASKKVAQGERSPIPQKQREWIKDQRKKLVTKTNAARKQDMEDYCQKIKEEGQRDSDSSEKEEVDVKRAELRNRLANKFKLDLAVKPKDSNE
ncbi:hypothetical protein BSKO_00087 [Bryopsis sp. KO-2023]|nr:hypothetical protein BSKO_00087 [Bryopsis sp. KO-2023]